MRFLEAALERTAGRKVRVAGSTYCGFTRQDNRWCDSWPEHTLAPGTPARMLVGLVPVRRAAGIGPMVALSVE